MKKIKLEDIFEPDPKEFGFKNKKDYEKKREENIKMYIKSYRYNNFIKISIVLLEIALSLNAENSDNCFMALIFLDIILFPIITIVLEKIYKPMYQKEIHMYDEKLREYSSISVPTYRLKQIYDKFIELEEKENKFLRPSYDYDICCDVFTVLEMKMREYEHEYILRAVDKMLIPNCKKVPELQFIYILNWLVEYNVISQEEAEERNYYTINLIEKLSFVAYGIITSGNKILLQRGKNGTYNLLSVTKESQDENIKEELIKKIEIEFNKKIKKLKFIKKYSTDINGNILDEKNYNNIAKSGAGKTIKYFAVYSLEIKTEKETKTKNLRWYNINYLKKDKLNPYTYEILCDANIIN